MDDTQSNIFLSICVSQRGSLFHFDCRQHWQKSKKPKWFVILLNPQQETRIHKWGNKLHNKCFVKAEGKKNNNSWVHCVCRCLCMWTWAETVMYLFFPMNPFKSLITSSAVAALAVILSVLYCQSHGNINRNLFLNSFCRKQQKKRCSAHEKILNVEWMKKTSIFCESQTF